MKNKHILLVIIILISLLFLNGCKKIENNGNNSHDYSDYQFYNVDDISYLELSSNIKSIGAHAFYNCLINNIFYNGTKEEWLNIEFKDNYSSPKYIIILDENGNLDYNGKKYSRIRL